jgi:hypothetical protein
MRHFLIAIIVASVFSTAEARIVVTNGLSHVHDLNVRAADRGSIKMKNLGSKAERVKIYLSDLGMDCVDGTKFLSPASTSRSSAEWLTLSSIEETLEPNESIEVQYQINKPEGLESEGSFWSFIMVENVPELDTNIVEGSVKVNTNFRYAIQIIAELGGGNGDMEFDSVYYNSEDGGVVLHMLNPSSHILWVQFELELFGSGEKSIQHIDESPTKIYPGLCRKVILPIDPATASGSYEGVIIAKSRNFGRFGYRLKIEIDE